MQLLLARWAGEYIRELSEYSNNIFVLNAIVNSESNSVAANMKVYRPLLSVTIVAGSHVASLNVPHKV
jgi:hypothetical protein